MNHPVTYRHIQESSQGQRIDNYLITALKGLPKSRIYTLLRKGEIRVNKKRVSPEYRLQAGDEIRIPPLRLGKEETPVFREDLFKGLCQRILYEDEHILVLNKPQGLSVHGGTHQSLGLIECLKQGFNNEKMELIHRLDKDTSGCLLIAKTRSALHFYHEIFKKRQVKKRYLALVYGRWPEKKNRVTLSLQIKSEREGSKKMGVSEEGQEAMTDFSILQYYSNATLVAAEPFTGRTHQIRVHAAAVGHPLLGDEKYGSRRFDKAVFKAKAPRLFLHALSLTFPHMKTQELLQISVEPDKGWKEALDSLLLCSKENL